MQTNNLHTPLDRQAPSAQTPLHPANAIERDKVVWPSTLYIVGFHVAALAGFFTFTWPAFILFLVLHWMTGNLGITLGYHRLLTHRSFEVPKPIEYFLAFLGSIASQGGPIKWVAAHRIHHAYSDTKGDPHSPTEGFWWAHMTWCMVKNKIIDSPQEYYKYAPDLAKDPVYRFMDNTPVFWTAVLAGIFYWWGGWPFLVWGIFVRTVCVYHITWMVNSATHVWGYRTYKSEDQSTNLWWVALLSFGEGWHNNHHAFQYSARHGLQWWEFDMTYMTIKILKLLGLATQIKLPPQYQLQTKIKA